MKLSQYNLTMPITQCMIRPWMIHLGYCRYDRHRQSYHAGGNERSDVLEMRVEYIKLKRKIALRQPLWIRIVKSPISAEELLTLKLPKETGDEAFLSEAFDCEVDGKESVDLHADLLNDDGCVGEKRLPLRGSWVSMDAIAFNSMKLGLHPVRHVIFRRCAGKCGKQAYCIGQNESA